MDLCVRDGTRNKRSWGQCSFRQHLRDSSQETACTYVVPDSSSGPNISGLLQLQSFLDEARDLLADRPDRSITNTIDGRRSDDIGRDVILFVCFEYSNQMLIIVTTTDDEGDHTGVPPGVILHTRGL